MSDRFEPPTLNCMMIPSISVFAYATPVFNGLVMVDPSQREVDVEKVAPSLAEKWTISPDGMNYTFHLRKGVYFHDNTCFQNGKGRGHGAQRKTKIDITLCPMRYAFLS